MSNGVHRLMTWLVSLFLRRLEDGQILSLTAEALRDGLVGRAVLELNRGLERVASDRRSLVIVDKSHAETIHLVDKSAKVYGLITYLNQTHKVSLTGLQLGPGKNWFNVTSYISQYYKDLGRTIADLRDQLTGIKSGSNGKVRLYIYYDPRTRTVKQGLANSLKSAGLASDVIVGTNQVIILYTHAPDELRSFINGVWFEVEAFRLVSKFIRNTGSGYLPLRNAKLTAQNQNGKTSSYEIDLLLYHSESHHLILVECKSTTNPLPPPEVAAIRRKARLARQIGAHFVLLLSDRVGSASTQPLQVPIDYLDDLRSDVSAGCKVSPKTTLIKLLN